MTIMEQVRILLIIDIVINVVLIPHVLSSRKAVLKQNELLKEAMQDIVLKVMEGKENESKRS